MSDAQDIAAFAQIVARDPESKRCFECGYPSAPWCDINHGIFVCLECSGQHRGLGVHLSFVRSSTMDGWSNWKPEKLRQMQAGGNSKCRAFFTKHNVPTAPIRERYMARGAVMYMDKLAADAAGQPFDEATWQPPAWWEHERQRMAGGAAQQQQQQQRYQGMGSAGSVDPYAAARPGGAGGSSAGLDFFSALGEAAAVVASTATTAASRAADVAVATGRTVVQKVDTMDRTDIDRGVTVASEVAKSAWGTFSSWTSYGVTSITTMVQEAAVNLGVEGAARTGDNDDDGLSALTRNVAPSRQAPAGDTDPVHAARYGHIEHQAERRPGSHNDDADGLAELARRVQVTRDPAGTGTGAAGAAPDGRYVGIGSSPVAPTPASSATAAGFKPKRSGFVPSGAASGSQTSTPVVATPSTSPAVVAPTTPTPAAAAAHASTSSPPAVCANVPAPSPAATTAKPPASASDDWAWDE